MNRSLLIPIAVVVDLAVMFAIFTWVSKRRGALGLFAANLTKVKEFADSAREFATSYLQSNYSGDPEQLPAVLDQLLLQLEAKAQEQGLTLDRPALKLVLAQLVPSDGAPSARDVMTALKKVA